MFKKFLTAVFCFVFLLGVTSLALAKKEGGSIEKVSEEASGIKDKIALSFSVGTANMSGDAGVRLWLMDSMGFDAQIFMGVAATVFNMGIGANLVFPMLEEENVNVYITPGFAVDFTSAGNVGFDFVTAVEAEAFLVKDLISVAGSIGLKLGIDVDSISTDFAMEMGTDTASLMFRIYIR